MCDRRESLCCLLGHLCQSKLHISLMNVLHKFSSPRACTKDGRSCDIELLNSDLLICHLGEGDVPPPAALWPPHL